MSDVLSSIGTFISSPAGQSLFKIGTAGAGFAQNYIANQEAQNKQKFVENLIQNPAKFNAYVNSFYQAPNAGLVADISRQTDAYGAERGLGSSSSVMRDLMAQALAPYEYQAQQNASNSALQALGVYENSPTTKPVDISSIMKMFLTPSSPGSAPIGALQPPPSVDVPLNLGSIFPAPSFPTLPSPIVGGGDPLSGLTEEF